MEVDGARVIDTGENLGFAGGGNVALRHWLAGDEPFAVIGSHDMHVEAETLGSLVDVAKRSERFGILGPAISTNWSGELLGHESGIELRGGVTGTCLLLRRQCIEQIGLFDPVFGSYGEDEDLCTRALKKGWKVGRVPWLHASGLGTSASDTRQLNSIANRILLSWRKYGIKGLVHRYIVIFAHLARSATGSDDTPPRVVARGLVLGTGRLIIGMVRHPPRCPCGR